MKKILLTLVVAAIALSCSTESTIPAPKPQPKPEQPDQPGQPGKDPADRTDIKILAIGNSFSVDAMQYLYDILKEAGYKNIKLGNLYIGSCTLATHANNLKTSTASYTYYTNTDGKWTSVTKHVANDAIASEKWDYISMQQASGSSGMPDTYEPHLSDIMTLVRSICPDATLMWHMTWAYQQDSNHAEFPKYDRDQMKMYNAIVNAVQTKVLTHNEFKFVIPCGTAIQDVRTSLIGDTVTRDGHHMSYNIGRFVTALTWARMITGESISGINFRPAAFTYTDEQIAAIKEAVENACATPYKVTESSYPPKNTPYESNAELLKVLVDAGYKAEDFKEVELRITHKAYYNSSSSSKIVSAENGSTATNLSQFACTQIFTREDIPTGSVIILKSGYQYRPEGWTALNVTNSTRPSNVKTQIVKVDSGWWGNWNYRAFNLAKSGNPALTDAEQQELNGCFAIYKLK